jgi:uncharacterized protein (DUF2062 family)
MWRLWQLTVVTAVVFSNIAWPWVDGGLAAGVVGGMVAYATTVWGVNFQLWLARRRETRLRGLGRVGE